MMRHPIFHITTRTEWDAAQASQVYRPAAFDREGFIHCSRAEQVAATAERIFRGREGLVLLQINPGALSCAVVEENLEGGTELYPHVYGALPVHAVVAVYPMTLSSDGRFNLPPTVTSL